MSETVVYLPEHDVICIMREGPADQTEIGLFFDFPCDFIGEYSKVYTNVDSVLYNTSIEFVGFL